MSSGLECVFVEPVVGDWYYFLQDWSCPVGAWNWLEYSTVYGTFTSLDEAEAHLRKTHANPGGYSIENYDDIIVSGEQEKYLKLIEDNK